MSTVEINGLRKSYDGKQVLHGIDVTIPSGNFAVIVGPSGCGKSTLLRMIAGLEDTHEGEIRIGARVVNALEPAARGCAMMFQNYALYPHMTVAENIAYPLRIARMPRPEREVKVRQAAEMLGLAALLDRRPAQLSGGQRQRVAMGRAIVREPEVFLFDEPLSNLDALLRVKMRIELKRLHRQLGTTSILVTHDQTEAMTLADTLIVMNGGRVEQIGAPAEVYRNPASTFVAGFLGAPAMNLIAGRVGADGSLIPDFAPALRLPLPLHLPEGCQITMGVRPEAITGGGGSGPMAAVELVEELGNMRIAHCMLEAQEIAVLLPAQATLKPGGMLSLRWEVADLCLFGAQGKRISAPQSATPVAQHLGA